MELLDFILDILFIGLLIAVLIYVFRLNKHIRILQDSKDELRNLLGQFVTSTERAEQALQRIKTRSRDATNSIDEAIAEAKSLKLELMDMIRRAEYASSNMTATLQSDTKNNKAGKSGRHSSPVLSDENETEIDKDLENRLNKLIESVESGNVPDADVDSNSFQADKNAAIEGKMIDEKQDATVETDPKSKSKEDLMKALRGA